MSNCSQCGEPIQRHDTLEHHKKCWFCIIPGESPNASRRSFLMGEFNATATDGRLAAFDELMNYVETLEAR